MIKSDASKSIFFKAIEINTNSVMKMMEEQVNRFIEVTGDKTAAIGFKCLLWSHLGEMVDKECKKIAGESMEFVKAAREIVK